jgi:hypothetical protein
VYHDSLHAPIAVSSSKELSYKQLAESYSRTLQPSAVQELVLNHSILEDDGFEALAPGLNRCSTLTKLSLSCCSLGPRAAALLSDILAPSDSAARLAVQPSLRFLNLSDNPFGAQGLINLCPGIRAAAALQSLGLRSIGIGGSVGVLGSVTQLASAVVASKQLQHLDMDGNPIGVTRRPSEYEGLTATCLGVVMSSTLFPTLPLRVTGRRGGDVCRRRWPGAVHTAVRAAGSPTICAVHSPSVQKRIASVPHGPQGQHTYNQGDEG